MTNNRGRNKPYRQLYFVVLIGGLALLLGIGPLQATANDTESAAESSFSMPNEPVQGLVIDGHVWLHQEGGPGLAGVDIYQSFAAYAGVVVATTDVNGYYQSDFIPIGSDENVTVWANLGKYTFDPEYYTWRHYGCCDESRTLNFIADLRIYLPLVLG